jgi:ABC-type uncharacterized transport system fused permease/ATPase subunit
MAQLWPLPHGRVLLPAPGPGGRASVLLVPQRTYAVYGSLRDQVTYPQLAAAAADPDTDHRVMSALGAVSLLALVAREGGLDTVKPWDTVLRYVVRFVVFCLFVLLACAF